MPQKSRSQKERAAARRESGQVKAPVSPAPIELQAQDAGSGVIITPPPAARRVSNTAALARNNEGEFNYSYVYSDLRRIGLLAILCFGVMIALAFFVR